MARPSSHPLSAMGTLVAFSTSANQSSTPDGPISRNCAICRVWLPPPTLRVIGALVTEFAPWVATRVKVLAPTVVGIPDSTPDGERVRPGGRSDAYVAENTVPEPVAV